MFGCPFSFKMPQNLMGPDDSVQKHLNEWRINNGEAWLDTVGPVMQERELKNIENSTRAKS